MAETKDQADPPEVDDGLEAAGAAPPAAAKKGADSKPPTWKQRLLRWSLLVVGVLLLLFFLVRLVGTTHHTGTVERVYEKGSEYRVEFWDERGKVHVVGNEDVRFPYFKLDTADLHAELNRFAKTGDLVELKVWGFRTTWLSMFPNAISVELLESGEAREERRARALAKVIEAELKNRGALKEGVQVQDAIVDAIVRAGRGSTPKSGSSPAGEGDE